MHVAHSVWFDEGDAGDKNTYALVKRQLENGNLNLQVCPDQGDSYPANDVPLRAEGGGRTYHVDYIG